MIPHELSLVGCYLHLRDLHVLREVTRRNIKYHLTRWKHWDSIVKKIYGTYRFFIRCGLIHWVYKAPLSNQSLAQLVHTRMLIKTNAKNTWCVSSNYRHCQHCAKTSMDNVRKFGIRMWNVVSVRLIVLRCNVCM